jgi:hypothetical protein
MSLAFHKILQDTITIIVKSLGKKIRIAPMVNKKKHGKISLKDEYRSVINGRWFIMSI